MSELFADLILENASQLLTIKTSKAKPIIKPSREDLAIIENGAIASCDGKIIDVGNTDEINSRVILKPHGKRIDCTGKIVMPGFVDPHTHILYSGSRIKEVIMRLQGKTYQEIQEAGGGIHYTVEATRSASDEDLFKRGMDMAELMLRHGSTTIEVKSGYGLNLEKEIKHLEIIKDISQKHQADIVSTFLGAHLVPEEYTGNRRDFVRLVVDKMIPLVAEKKLADFCDVFCEYKAFTVDESREILLKGISCGLLPRIHADELQSSGGSELAGEIKAVSADHLNYISDKGIDALAENGVIAVLLPGTSFFLNLDRFPPGRKMIEKEVPIALATDYNAGSCWTYSMQIIISLACLKMKLTPEEALIASTINSACAVNRQDEVGSLEIGKKADILILDVNDYSHFPFYFGTNQVRGVIKRGKIVFLYNNF